jgi:hypothetical protein
MEHPAKRLSIKVSTLFAVFVALFKLGSSKQDKSVPVDTAPK